MNQLQIQGIPTLHWVPDIYQELFWKEAWETYEWLSKHEPEKMVCLHEMVTYFNSDLILNIASYHETAGEDENFFHNEVIQSIPNEDVTLFQILDDEYYDCFESIGKILEFQRITHCHLSDPEIIREHLLHYAVEVW